MIRETIYQLLAMDDVLRAELGDDHVWNIESVDNPDRQKPFLVIAWADAPPVFGKPGRRSLTVWAHDEGGDYTRIDRLLERVRILLVEIVHQGGISQVNWEGASGDLYDDGFHTITRNSSFRVIGADREEPT